MIGGLGVFWGGEGGISAFNEGRPKLPNWLACVRLIPLCRARAVNGR